MAVFTANNLYPGTIDTAMPGFNVEDGQVKIYFNFSQYNDITKIKQNYIQVTLKYQNNNLNALNDASEIILKNWNQDDNGYYFILEDSDLKDEEFIPYQYYKLQFRLTDIAASDKTGAQTIDNWLSAASTISGKTNLDESSEWSTICLIRGITALTLEVEGLTAGGNLQSVSNLDNVIGHVSFTAEDNIENTEYLKTVNLKLYDKDNVLIKDSGEIICDNYKAPNYFNYSFDYKFQKGNENPYKMEIVCITNTLYQETFIYNFYITEENIDFDFSPNLTTITDSETGTIKLGVEYKDSGLADTLKIYRTAAIDNYSEKKEIYSGSFVKASESSYEYVNGSGTSISLNNTMQSKMKMSLAPSELEQITYTGKNLYDVSKFIQGTWNNSSSNSRVVGFLKAVSTGESYTVSLYNTAYQFSIGNSTTNTQGTGTAVQSDSGWKTTTYTYNITGDGYLWVQIAKVNSDTITPSELKATDLQVETGSSSTNFEPYVGGTASPNPEYPQDIHTISGNNSVVVEGKNKLKKITSVSSGTNNNGIITTTNVTNTGINLLVYFSDISVNNGDTIYFSADIKLNSGSSGVYNIINDGVTANANKILNPTLSTTYQRYQTSLTYSSSTTLKRILIQFFGVTGTIEVSNIMISNNSNVTYVPYQEPQTKTINLGTENLIDIYTLNNGYINSSGGTAPQTSGSYERYSPFIKVKPNTEYTFKILECTWENFGTYNWIGVGEYTSDSDSSFIQRDIMATKSQDYYTFTTTATTQYVRISARGLTYATKIQFSEEALWKDKNVYTPFGTNIEYCKIGDYEDKFILTSGKNLFDKDVETKNAFPVTTVGNSLTFTNSTASISYVNCAYLEVGKTYKLSWEMTQTPASTSARNGCIVDNNNIILEQIQTFGNNTSPMTITPTHSGYLVLCTDKNTSNIMLNKGTTALPYEPYNNGKWYLKKNIGKVVLDGSESYSRAGTGRFILTTPNIALEEWSLTTPILTKSNYFIGARWIEIYRNLVDNAISSHVSAHQIVIQTSLFDDIASFKSWLSIHNTIVYYVLATPQYILLNNDLQEELNKVLMSYAETTNISQTNNDLSFNITASALKDTSSLLVNSQYLDTSFESGILYKYEVKAVNTKDNLKSKEFETESPIGVMFDHMYLKSGNQQLKIKFNPQINSMKTIYSENKTDTLGSQYPFIKRNAAVKYRTFPISGLISYFMDGEHYFSSRSFEYGDNLNDYNTFNNNNQITSTRDYTYERLFRERVRNFLEDNKVKLFRSPTEGNMLVKLMDINFSPNQSTGRLIWNFSATAYEIDDMTIDNLKKYGIIPMDIDNNFGEDDYINDPVLFSYMPHTSEEGSI